MPQQPLGQDAGERRHIHLDEIGQVAVEHVLERVAHMRMVAAEREHAEAAQQVEIAGVGVVKKILAPAGREADVEADGLQHPHHLFIQMPRVQRVSLRFPLREQRCDIVRPCLSLCRLLSPICE